MNPRSSSRLRLVIGLALFVAFAAWFFLGRKPAAPMAAATPPAATPTPTPVAAVLSSSDKSSAKPRADEFDFRAACEAARKIPHPRQRTPEFGRLVQQWLAQDPDAVLAYVRTLPRGAAFTQALFLVLNSIAEKDPAHALALAGELAQTRDEQVIFAPLFAQLAARDLPSALRQLTTISAGEARDHALRAVGDTWAKTDFAAALAWGQGMTAPLDRSAAVESILATLVASDPARVVVLAQQSLTGPALDRTLLVALPTLSSADASSAARILATLPAGELKNLLVPDVARALAAQDPATAMAWANTLSDEKGRALATNTTLELWASKNPAGAAQYVHQMPSGPGRSSAADTVARAFGSSSPQEAINWAQTLNEPELIHSSLVTIGSSWAQRDASAASLWAATLPSAETRDETLRGTLSYWVLSDANSAEEFVRKLPADAQLSAAAAIAPLLAQSHPETMLTWAQTLPEPAARDAAIVAGYARWRDNAPAAAQSWLASSNLPEATKAKIANPAKE